jgi:hypothetical protein
MTRWTLDDIRWQDLDRSKLDPEMVRIVKAACMVEHHSADYGAYLNGVFRDDPAFCAAATRWAEEEIQHGKVLRRYAELADPTFDFATAFGNFTAGHKIDVGADRSIRGSRCGELVARCIVEVGTSTYYSVLRDTVREPVLREICARIAGDEFRHYKLFYGHMKRYQQHEHISILARVKVAFGRLLESGDDELAYAYYCGSGETGPYDRRRCAAAYAGRSLPHYRFVHVERGLGMTLKVLGLKPQSLFGKLITRVLWWIFRLYAGHVGRVVVHG